MTWHEQWRALAGRIDGLIRAGEFLASAFQVNSADNFDVVRKSLLPELAAITSEIERLGQAYASELPPNASDALKSFVARRWRGGLNVGKVDIQALAPLAAFRHEFEYLVRDSEVEGRSLAELAFEHLRRLIVVDKDVRRKWHMAFERHETACERLGAVHLLSHGIWAFKVVAAGGATDLVFGDPAESRQQGVRRTARALVLTERKRVKKSDEILAKSEEGRMQAASYGGGVLGDTELKRTRYVVLVCKTDLPAPDDVTVGSATYHHVVIPVKPVVPSLAARSRNRGRKS